MIYAVEHHDQVLNLWREQEAREIRLAHVDFHDDLRGLLVDRARGRAYAIGKLARGRAPVDAGNFLAHAVLERRLDSVRWVHGTVGGRAWDAGIVRYESDLFALPHRLRHAMARGPEFSLRFEEVLVDGWGGLQRGERLSVDWDCFASVLQDAQGIQERIDSFLERLGEVAPLETYVCYSPEYCHPSLQSFRAFVVELASRYGQSVEWLSPGLERARLNPTGVDPGLPRDVLMRIVLYLRRRGIY